MSFAAWLAVAGQPHSDKPSNGGRGAGTSGDGVTGASLSWLRDECAGYLKSAGSRLGEEGGEEEGFGLLVADLSLSGEFIL
jgi:hypothetical protein